MVKEKMNNLEKYYKKVRTCSRNNCRRKFGDDTVLGSNVCPRCKGRKGKKEKNETN